MQLNLRLFFVGIFLILGGGCHSVVPQNLDTLVVGIEAYPENLDPRTVTDALSSKITRLIYNGLFQLNDRLEVVPDLAAEVKPLDDRGWLVTLKEGVAFQNGKPLTADDVIATYQSVLDPRLSSPQRVVFEKIDKLEKVDDRHLKILLKEPFAPIFAALTLGILPEEIAKGSFSPVGTGPYAIGPVHPRDSITLVRNANYFGTRANEKQILFRVILDDTLRTLELIKGRLDLVQNSIPLALLPAIEKRADKLNLVTAPGINFTYLGLNLKDPILANPKVRQALAMGINRDAIIEDKLHHHVVPATSLLFPGHWAFNHDLVPVRYDPEQAKKLLDEAGYPDPDGDGKLPRFRLEYKTSSKKDRIEMALLIASQLKEIGVQVTVKSFEWGTFYQDVRQGHFQMASLSWVGVTDPDIYFAAFDSSQFPPVGANRGFYQNRELDRLVEEGRRTLDPVARKALYDPAQKIVLEDLPIIPLWYEDNWVVTRKNVEGYVLRPDAGFQGLAHVQKINAPRSH